MRAAALLAVVLALGCHSTPSSSGQSSDAGTDAGASTPVTVAAAERRTLDITVRGAGRTDALEQQKIHAPFKGRLLSLTVAAGDLVQGGAVIGEMLSQESDAALTGAQAMAESARTAREKADAGRALQLAKKNAVRAQLRVPETSLVVSHSVDEGSLIPEGQEIVSLAATDSFTFRAELSQAHLPQVKEGQRVIVRLPSHPGAIEGTVHSILPGPASPGLVFAVRVDLKVAEVPALGLFGTAEIVVGTAENVVAVPEGAVLRDDLTGRERIAVVNAQGLLHWQDVTTGARQAGWVEVRGNSIAPGARVITQGQVGLPDGALVRVSP